MHIGLIGGIGVAATLVYYQRLVAAIESLGARPDITIVHAHARDLVRNNLADDREPQAQIYAALINRLKAAGCDCAAITSLGGHFCYEETLPLSSLPLVSAVAPLDRYFASQNLSSVGLLGTRIVMQTGFYGQLNQTKPIALTNDLDQIGQTYTDMAIAGKCTATQRSYFLDAGKRLVDAGAEAVVLAGTDLNLAFDGQDTDYRVIDALDVHVDVLARLGANVDELPTNHLTD